MNFCKMKIEELVDIYKREIKRKARTAKIISRILKYEDEIERRKGSKYLNVLNIK
jgi:hypothetical protein